MAVIESWVLPHKLIKYWNTYRITQHTGQVVNGGFPFAMSSFLDQYLGGEELGEMILEEENIFDNDLP